MITGRSHGRALWAAGVLALCAASVALLLAQENPGRDALWTIVHNQCVPNETQHHDPKPCTQVDLSGGEQQGFAILKDIHGASQYLLIPTAHIPGIESRELLAPGTPNYFEDAWEARGLVGQALHKTVPREDISLAVNSARSRSQDQLHIHIDCVRSEVRAAVREHAAEIDSHWSSFPVALLGHHYQAIWEPGEDLRGSNPFQLLVAGMPGAGDNIGDRTLVVVGASHPGGIPGFLILEDEVNRQGNDLASGEELQDHACAVAGDSENN